MSEQIDFDKICQEYRGAFVCFSFILNPLLISIFNNINNNSMKDN